MAGLQPQTTPQKRFSGGLNLYVSDVDVAANEMLIAYNCRLRANRIETAPGFIKYSTQQLAGAVQTIWGSQLGVNYYLVVAAGGHIYLGASSAFTSIYNGLNTSGVISMDTYGGRLFIGDGTHPNLKFDGTTVSLQGVQPPTDIAITEVDTGSGAFPVGYQIQVLVTFWDSLHSVESNPNPDPATLTVSSGGPANIQITTMPTTTDANITGSNGYYRIYITESMGSGNDFFRNIQIPYIGNAGMAYTIATAALGTPIAFDNFVPSIFSLCVSWKNSLFMVYASTLSFLNFTKVYQPEQINPEFRVGLGDTQSENIVALIRFYDFLVIGTNLGVWILTDHPLNGALPYRLTNYIGMANSRSWGIRDNLLYFLGTDFRIYTLDPTNFSQQDVRPEYVSQKLEPFMSQISPDALPNAVGIFHHVLDRFEMLMSVPVGSNSNNNYVVVQDATTQGWTIDEKRVSAFAKVINNNNNIALYHGDENGYVYIDDQGYGYGATISGTVESATSNTITDASQASLISTATAGGTSALTDSTQSWATNQWFEHQVYINSGTGAGQYRTVSSNNGDTLTVSEAWSIDPDNTSEYIMDGFIQNALNGLTFDIVAGTLLNEELVVASHTPITLTFTTSFPSPFVPDTTSVYTVGGIDFNINTGWDFDTQLSENTKRGMFHNVVAENQVQGIIGSTNLTFQYARDLNYNYTDDYNIVLNYSGYLWNVALWNMAYWGQSNTLITSLPFQAYDEYYQRIQLRFRNRLPGQPIQIPYVTRMYQDKGYFLNA